MLYFTILSTCEDHTSGWFRNSGSTPGLAPTLRDVTVLFFRLLLKKTVLSQSEGHLNLLNPRPRGGTLRKRDAPDLPRSGSTPDLRRVRPHYVDSTASRPICEVKLRQAGLVVWFVRTCEVLVLYFIYPIEVGILQGGLCLLVRWWVAWTSAWLARRMFVLRGGSSWSTSGWVGGLSPGSVARGLSKFQSSTVNFRAVLQGGCLPRLGLEYFRVGLHSSFALAPRHADLTAPHAAPTPSQSASGDVSDTGALRLARGCQGSDQPPAEYRRPPRPLRWDHGTGRRPDEPSAPVGGPPTHHAGPVREQPPPHGPPRARTPLVARRSPLWTAPTGTQQRRRAGRAARAA